MLRWETVEDKEIEQRLVKMYRDPYEAEKVQTVPGEGLDFEHYAFKYLGDEKLMYKILDTNFIEIMEERGDMSRLKTVKIPIKDKSGFATV